MFCSPSNGCAGGCGGMVHIFTPLAGEISALIDGSTMSTTSDCAILAGAPALGRYR